MRSCFILFFYAISGIKNCLTLWNDVSSRSRPRSTVYFKWFNHEGVFSVIATSSLRRTTSHYVVTTSYDGKVDCFCDVVWSRVHPWSTAWFERHHAERVFIAITSLVNRDNKIIIQQCGSHLDQPRSELYSANIARYLLDHAIFTSSCI